MAHVKWMGQSHLLRVVSDLGAWTSGSGLDTLGEPVLDIMSQLGNGSYTIWEPEHFLLL